MASQEFYSIESEATDEIVVKGSRFIGHAAPAADPAAAKDYVARVSDEFQDATHNCYAYKIGVGDSAAFRFYDDGEPSGTAGRPILQAIETKTVTNLAVVVTRYFGGTKLGTGGLIRAYSAAALGALNKAKIIINFPQVTFYLKFAYQFTNSIHQVIEKYKAKILESRFEERTIYQVQLKAAEEKKFKDELRDLTCGKIEFAKVRVNQGLD